MSLQNAFGFDFREAGPPDAARTIVALHGSGADETQLLPLAYLIDPAARIVAPRGRIDQNGERRWYRKITPTSFDQRDIRAEARAFAACLDGMLSAGRLRAESTVFLGYSNGGNLLHSTMLLHPGRVRRAMLLRCMPVLRKTPRTGLAGLDLLIVGGRPDETYGPFGEPLCRLLRRAGARIAFHTVDAGHEVGEQDAETARRWLAALSG